MNQKVKVMRWSCDACETVVDVKDHAADLYVLLEGHEEDPSGFRCGVCGGPIRRNPHAHIDSDVVTHLSLSCSEFWRWSHYVLQIEKEKDLEWVQSVAVGSEVKELELRADQGRCLIDSVTLNSGIKLCIGASGLGAMIERVEKNGRKHQWPSDESDSTGGDDPKSEPEVKGRRDAGEGLPGSGPEPEVP